MTRPSDAIVLLFLSAGSVFLGYVLCTQCFSYLPLLWGMGLAVAFVACFIACAALGRGVKFVLYLVTALGYSIAFAGLVFGFTGVGRVERYECTWRMAAKGVEVDLGPGFGWSLVRSPELAHHLQKDQPPKASVEVEIIRDFGHVRARGMIRSVDGIIVDEP